jgi:hypothetical protein
MKTCKADNCISPVFSHLYCQRHQYLRTDKKKARKELGIKKIKITTVRDNIQASFGFEDQITLFEALWDANRNYSNTVTCPYTGEVLYKSSRYYINYFAHILPKKNYPFFKLNPANIQIVSNEFHRIIDQGSTKDRLAHPDWKWDLWDAKVIEMKEEYLKFKIKNLLP